MNPFMFLSTPGGYSVHHAYNTMPLKAHDSPTHNLTVRPHHPVMPQLQQAPQKLPFQLPQSQTREVSHILGTAIPQRNRATPKETSNQSETSVTQQPVIPPPATSNRIPFVTEKQILNGIVPNKVAPPSELPQMVRKAHVDTPKYSKPFKSYIELIACAILASPQKKLMLHSIYSHIENQ